MASVPSLVRIANVNTISRRLRRRRRLAGQWEWFAMGQVHIQPGGGGSVEAALSVRVYSERRYQLRQGKWV